MRLWKDARLRQAFRKAFSWGHSLLGDPSWQWAAGYPLPNGAAVKPPTREEILGNSAFYSGATLYSDTLATFPIRVTQSMPTGGSRIVTNTDAVRALQQLRFDQKEMVFFQMVADGNGYLRIRKSGRGSPASLDPVSSWRVSLAVRDGDAAMFYQIQRDDSIGEPEETIPADEMIHFKMRTIGKHGLLGTPVMATVLPSLELVAHIRTANSAVYRNVSSPAMSLQSPKPLNPEAADRLKAQWQERMTGQNLGKVVILDNDLKPVPIEIGKAIDLQFDAMSRVTVAEVSRALRIPMQLLAEQSSLNYNTALELGRTFASFSLQPITQRVADAFTFALLSPSEIAGGMRVEIDLSSIVRGHGSELSEYLSRLANSGLISPNEARHALGYESKPDGDELRAPVNAEPLSDWANGETEPSATRRMRDLLNRIPKHG